MHCLCCTHSTGFKGQPHSHTDDACEGMHGTVRFQHSVKDYHATCGRDLYAPQLKCLRSATASISVITLPLSRCHSKVATFDVPLVKFHWQFATCKENSYLCHIPSANRQLQALLHQKARDISDQCLPVQNGEHMKAHVRCQSSKSAIACNPHALSQASQEIAQLQTGVRLHEQLAQCPQSVD